MNNTLRKITTFLKILLSKLSLQLLYSIHQILHSGIHMVVYQSGPSTKGDYATSSTAFILEAEGEGMKTATKKRS